MLNEEGFRVIAVAYKAFAGGPATRARSPTRHGSCCWATSPSSIRPRRAPRAAIAALRTHGVAVKVLTGDNELVTRNVCRQVGLARRSRLLGSDIDGDDGCGACARVETATIFAKLAPAEKARVIAGAARQRARRRLSRRRHQRRTRPHGRRRRHLGRFGGRRRQGARGHHPAREEPARAATMA